VAALDWLQQLLGGGQYGILPPLAAGGLLGAAEE
jgi:hypothetical protein